MKIHKNIIIKGNHQKPVILDILYDESALQAGKVIIFCHGFKGFKDWGHFPLLCKRMSQAGFVVVKFNFSHNGGTLDQPIDFPDLEAFSENNYSKELDDLGTVIDYIYSPYFAVEDFKIQQINLIGHSRGGGIVLLRAAEDKRVNAVVTWASVDDFGKRFLSFDLKKWQKDGVVFIKNGRTKQDMPLKYQFYEDYLRNKNRLDIPKQVKTLNIPVLVCHGTADEAVNYKAAQHLKALNRHIQLFLVENAGHTFNGSHPWKSDDLPENSEKLLKATLEFLKKHSRC